MLREILIIGALSAVVVYGQEGCDCVEEPGKPVCGADNVTYPSFCTLLRTGCVRGEVIEFKCDGRCPCDPVEIRQLDEKTVSKLAQLRKDIQLEIHAKELEGEVGENDSQNVVSLEILENENVDAEDEGYSEDPGLYGCLPAERSELPKRLIDWFHVIKTNKREEKYKEGIAKEPVLKEMKFIDGKLKAMYARLACADNDVVVEKEVCLSSVKWMFSHLDVNKDNDLSPIELLEIEEINSEHCIKPFLKTCDRNQDGQVLLEEFCKCLCVTPPCTLALGSVPTVLLHGKPMPFPGMFAPSCDEDGFFMPMQENKRKGEYWCVNRNGAEIDGTRNKTKVKCGLNTREANKYQLLIPLDMKEENAAVSP